ncbi:carbohydrate ABC transporter permease [Dictyobacter arantiisoli]|uniref:ABC transporter permease n=1 Tax=Dictyobacter arantiisoli TaxID=2014874 RepID=A0A5A5TF09_9CHLR|nr:carbohydrate ABC transporter permease [Dictyobacter arantiisoli]GCF10002.1 ABC transporter permease [Dictyobacter arantiisoli]
MTIQQDKIEQNRRGRTLSGTTVNKQPGQKPRSRRIGLGEIFPAILGLIWLVFACYPIVYMLFTSLRPQADIYKDIAWSFPSHPTLDNYTTVLSNDFGTYFANTVFVTVLSVLIILAVSLLAAYAISQVRNRFTQSVFNLFLLGLAIPLQATIIPIYAIVSDLHLYDTLFALILPSIAFGIPLSILVLVTYIRDIPNELHESMMLDGAKHFRILCTLVLPLARPAIITVIIYETIQVWNSFLFPLVLTQSQEVQVLPLSLMNFQGQFTTNVPAIMAAVFLSATPIILLYIFGRRQLLGGLVAGFSK